MSQRIAYGAFAVAVIFGLVGCDALIARTPPFGIELLSRGSLIPVILALISIVACLELTSMFRRIEIAPYRRWAMFSCVVLVLAPWFSAAGLFGVGPFAVEAFHLQMELTALAFLGAGVMSVLKQDVQAGLKNVSATWLIIGYAGVLPSFLVMLRCDLNVPGEYGAWVLLCVILVCKVSDIGAYFVGSWIGKRKLIPSVSPAKSVEGLLGGILASCTVSLLFYGIHHATMLTEAPHFSVSFVDRWVRLGHEATMMYHKLNIFQTIVFGVLMSIVGQLGDLVESVFKRSADTKDSANILPGFGGILDMVDSPVAIAPVAWFLLTRAWDVL